jgi:hypothetical protein
MALMAAPTTEMEILAHVVAPEQKTFEPMFARWVLGMRFDDEVQDQIRQLLEKNNQGALSETERSLLDKYLRVGQFIDLLQAKARLTLAESAQT